MSPACGFLNRAEVPWNSDAHVEEDDDSDAYVEEDDDDVDVIVPPYDVYERQSMPGPERGGPEESFTTRAESAETKRSPGRDSMRRTEISTDKCSETLMCVVMWMEL